MRFKGMAAVGAVLLAACSTVAVDPGQADTAHYGPDEANRWTGTAPTVVESYDQDAAQQFGELRVPRGKGPFPVAMLVHGGCWLGMGSTRNMNPLADWLTARGVATWNIDWRDLSNGGGWPRTFQDWASALAALNGLAKRYPLDLGRVSVIGHSAGVTPAVWLASGSQGDGVLAHSLPKVRSGIVLDGPVDLAQFSTWDKEVCGKPVIAPLMGGTPAQQPARYAMIDPRSNPPAGQTMVLVRGAFPAFEPAMVAALGKGGAAVEEIVVTDGQHFDMLKPGTPDFAKIAPALRRATGAR